MNLPPPPDRWTIDIANAERVNAISSFGLTERQSRFLVNVLLHAGVFVERQYCAFAGIVHGQKSTDFIKTLVERRFATPTRAYARPSGLDGACAQMIGRHLCDGHRMLLLSGTNGALIDPSNSRTKRSHMFDRFRTRAFRPLDEVHFSRFCPLTSVASGASLFAFDGAATHHPPRSVTDVEQPLIVAHRAAINFAPRRGRSATNVDHRRPRAKPPRLRLAGRSRRR